jgi:lipoprotein-anchoring transpeptidase ErfK/SrfK
LIGAAATVYLSQPQAIAVAQAAPISAANAENVSVSNDSAPPAPTVQPPEPTATATLPLPATATTEPTDSPTPTLPPTAVPTVVPLPTATPEPPTPEPVVLPTEAPQPTADTSSAQAAGSGANGERWIDVDLNNQRLVAYEGQTPVRWVTVSTGLPGTPTVTGQYHIYVKYLSQTMSGPGYYLPDVPYVMYFYEGYGIHGTYWHHNFGHPMSHGCVNTPTPDAQWLYNWADVGTLVYVHY